MQLTNSLTRSLLLHALLLVLILVQIQKSKPIATSIPKKWIMDVKVVLPERELQLPQQGVKGANNDMSPAVKTREKAVANRKPAGEDTKSENISNPVEATSVNKSAPVDSGKTEESNPAFDTNPPMQQAFSAQVNAQFMLMHMNAFFNVARLSTQAFIQNSITGENSERLSGKTAFVQLLYREDGVLENVEVFSESEELKSLMEKISWKAVPLPRAYYLSYKGIGMQIAIQYGSPQIGIKVLP